MTYNKNDLYNQIVSTVQERGFYLYEWISEEEFRKSIQLDYFTLLENFGITIIIISLVATFVGGAHEASVHPEIYKDIIENSPTDSGIYLFLKISFFAILYALPYTIASIFLGFILVIIILTGKTVLKGNIYRKIANITIVDQHVVTNENIIPHGKFQQNEEIKKIAELFHEQPFDDSYLNKATNIKSDLSQHKIHRFWENSFDFAKSIKSKDKYGRETASGLGFFLMILFWIIRSVFYGIMKMMNYLFLPIVAVFSSLFSVIYHKISLLTHGTEYKIQHLFEQLDESTKNLQKEKENIIFSLNEAKNNNWMENLSGKINTIFQKINSSVNEAISQNLQLKKTLENSHYKDIFNFGTFHNWTKKQIVEPIISLSDLLQKNEKIIAESREKIQNQIQNTADKNLQKPLILQEKRLEIQIAELQKMQKILEEYLQKLN